jgi:hypothetical protein
VPSFLVLRAEQQRAEGERQKTLASLGKFGRAGGSEGSAEA